MTRDASMTELVSALGDRYIIEREIGAGGMATLYLARVADTFPGDLPRHHRLLSAQ
jgi:hypothetical protein